MWSVGTPTPCITVRIYEIIPSKGLQPAGHIVGAQSMLTAITHVLVFTPHVG